MEKSVSRDTHPREIIISWVIVLIPILWAVYCTFTTSLEMMRH
jgi:hypothetical protein